MFSVFCISAATNGDIKFDKSFLLLYFFRLDFVVAVNVGLSGKNYLCNMYFGIENNKM